MKSTLEWLKKAREQGLAIKMVCCLKELKYFCNFLKGPMFSLPYIYTQSLLQNIDLYKSLHIEPKDKQRNISLNTMELDLTVFRQAQHAEVYHYHAELYPYHYTELYPYHSLVS